MLKDRNNCITFGTWIELDINDNTSISTHLFQKMIDIAYEIHYRT